MSDSNLETAPTQPQGKDRRKSLQSGFSLLARGEPQIWFIGGMLVICIAMIVGLLGLILYRGLPNFWPKPVDWLVLSDGRQDIGQPQKQRYVAEGEGNNTTSGISYYYRTGNYDVTGNHYRWFNPEELAASGIARPEQAMVVERLEYGRLYGIPVEYSELQAVDDQSATQLATLEELISTLESCVPDTDTEEHESALEALRQGLVQKKSQALEALLDQMTSLPPSESKRVQLQLAEDSGEIAEQWLAASEYNEEQNIASVRTLILDSAAAARAIHAAVPQMRQLRHEGRQIRERISRLDSRISELRAGVRRAEIATEEVAAQQLELSHYIVEQAESTRASIELLEDAEQMLNDLSVDTTIRRQVQEVAAVALEKTLPAQLEQLAADLDSWREPIQSQPQEIVDSVEAYISGYREVYNAKRPLEREIEEIETQLAACEAVFLLPNFATPVRVDQTEIVDSLGSKEPAEAALPALQESGVELSSWETADYRLAVDDENLAIAFLTTDDGARQGLSINRLAGDKDGEDEQPPAVNLLNRVPVRCSEIVRAVEVNRLSFGQKCSVYMDRWREFLWENPREANTEGGVFPAIWGTIVMTMIMTIAVVPFGVMAALYLREYAGAGPLVSIIRISINNLAGVPSIVYGVFGFSFFCYTIGAYLDGGPENADITPWPHTVWFLWLGMAALTGTTAFFLSFLSGGSRHTQTSTSVWISRLNLVLWLTSIAIIAFLLLKSPFFHGFYREYLPNPTYGKGGLLWAALTLALLTLPVVIVATEEALAAVPNSLRQGSLACGASKWQTIRRIVLPHARPGILTGAILAMARGAGEVAPLMLVGALPAAPDLPMDTEFPFFHGSRSFMHLGYQIYTLGFTSQNSEASVPMVFTCTLLLILIVATLNVFAILLRARLKRRFQGSQF